MKKNKQHVLFFVGPDRVGKTEIAKEVSRRTKIPYFKASSEHDSFLNNQSSFLDQLNHAEPRVLDILSQTGHSMIFDRGWPCEAVYSTVYQRETNVGLLDRIDDGYDNLDATIVLCYRSSYEGLQDDLDPSITSDKLQEISDMYFEMSDNTACRWAFINVDSEDLDVELAQLAEQVQIPGLLGSLWTQIKTAMKHVPQELEHERALVAALERNTTRWYCVDTDDEPCVKCNCNDEESDSD